KICVIIDLVDKNYCLIDGQVRRKKCNVTHLDPLDKLIKIEKNASHEKIKEEFKKLGLEIIDSVKKEKKTQEKPQEKKEAKETKKPKTEKGDKKSKK
ncbi:MAG: hypothetical protein Q8O89_03650, partial [Nanoarchaeota archaeon]|nr:hypothetical protein [Nanoarchaeota archaeon]